MSYESALLSRSCTSAPARPRSLGARVLAITALWKSRRHLAQLDAEALRDVGISPLQAQQEAARAPWDVPAHWRN